MKPWENTSINRSVPPNAKYLFFSVLLYSFPIKVSLHINTHFSLLALQQPTRNETFFIFPFLNIQQFSIWPASLTSGRASSALILAQNWHLAGCTCITSPTSILAASPGALEFRAGWTIQLDRQTARLLLPLSAPPTTRLLSTRGKRALAASSLALLFTSVFYFFFI